VYRRLNACHCEITTHHAPTASEQGCKDMVSESGLSRVDITANWCSIRYAAQEFPAACQAWLGPFGRASKAHETERKADVRDVQARPYAKGSEAQLLARDTASATFSTTGHSSPMDAATSYCRRPSCAPTSEARPRAAALTSARRERRWAGRSDRAWQRLLKMKSRGPQGNPQEGPKMNPRRAQDDFSLAAICLVGMGHQPEVGA